ncbi:HTTM domain-containing protein [Streptomyces ovatisporus]|uniref:HTTM domain-containing protein n=1 Tax=Streptomyces ovatisporus TaxID=1128682 RepID=A0ABV9A9X5_9ACTN
MPTEQTTRLPHQARRTGVPSILPAGRQRVAEGLRSLRAALTQRPVSLYAAAVLRMGYGFLYLALLLREFPHRDELWGPGSAWTPDLSAELTDETGFASILALSDSRPYFETCYALAVVVAVLFMLGWRTRAISLLFAVIVASFHSRAIYMTDGGDNLVLLMSLYLSLTACGRRWSLDARRLRRRTAVSVAKPRRVPAQLGIVRGQATTVLHNCAMFVIAVQVAFLYGSAGLFKVQGNFWGDGTALHYVLNLDLFRPWPELSLLVDQQTVLIAIAGYLSVLLQVAFPFVLFSKVKYVVLPVMLGMHLAIAVLLGLPFFSGAMIVADAVFLPDRFFTFLAGLRGRIGQPATHTPKLDAPAQPKAVLPAQQPTAGGAVGRESAPVRSASGPVPPP